MSERNARLEFKGIYGLETLQCGCQVKRYGLGGKVIIIASTTCKNLINCTTKIKFICGKCGSHFSKRGLKEHQWEHAV